MAQLNTYDKDILTHIDTDKSLRHQAIITEGCITILDANGIKLKLCWDLEAEKICTEVKLIVFGQTIELGKQCIDPNKTITISKHVDSNIKVEIILSFEIDPLQLCFDAKACIKLPLLGNWQCADTGKKCISL